MRCLGEVERLFVPAGQRNVAAPPRVPETEQVHRIPADLFVLPIGEQVFGNVLLRKAHEPGADMIVMGAFVRDPVRRLVPGGLTRFMLFNTDRRC